MAKKRTKRPGRLSSSTAELEQALRSIPGYDPWTTAGDCTFDAEAAVAPIQFFKKHLRHTKGSLAGQPFELLSWQQAIVGNLFGWKRPDGTRRYREAFIFVPRKNGKTPLAAGIGTYVLFCDAEAGAECYCAAVDREQAGLVFSWAKQMVLEDEALRDNSQVFVRSITRDEVGSFFKVLSSDAPGKHGQNSHLVIVDELHAQPNRDLVDVLLTSIGARRQPLVMHFTTSDYDRESICNEKYDYACKVRDGIINDPSFLPVIYEASKDDDWKNPETWKKANPSIGVAVNLEYLARECQRAQESPAYENTFKRLHLNIKTEQDVRWISMEKWDECSGTIDPDALRGRLCYGGLDLASTTDIAALSLAFPEDDGNGYSILPFFWIPGESATQRERRDRVPYLTWARQGLVEMTDGNCIDYDVIRAKINELGRIYQIKEIGLDPWNATQLANQLTGDGFELVAFRQGFASLTAPTKEFQRLYLEGNLHHGSNPVLRWMASNVSVELDAAGNIKPSKKKSTEKIDGIVATVMAIGMATAEPAKKQSIYDQRLRDGKGVLQTI